MPLISTTTSSNRTPWMAFTAASALLLGLAAGGVWSVLNVTMVPSAVPPSLSVQADTPPKTSLSADAHSRVRLSAAGPQWRDLSASQRQILTPLRDRWSSMGALAKRRWMVLADRYPQMEETERTKLDSRMRTWANLSAQQRNQARLNFESVKSLSPQELQAKWDEYQALSEARKRELAEQARKAKASKTRVAKRRPTAPAKPPVPVTSTPATPEVTTHPVSTPGTVELSPVAPLAPSSHEASASPANASHPPAASLPVQVPNLGNAAELPPLDAAALPPADGHPAH